MDTLTAKNAIAIARDIMESFDDSDAMTIYYDRPDKPTYTLTAEQMQQIAAALYLADCMID